jgi:hypothetical protein
MGSLLVGMLSLTLGCEMTAPPTTKRQPSRSNEVTQGGFSNDFQNPPPRDHQPKNLPLNPDVGIIPKMKDPLANNDPSKDPSSKNPSEERKSPIVEEEEEPKPEGDIALPSEGKIVPLNNKDVQKATLFFQNMPDGSRRVIVRGEVCLRRGPLEMLLCKVMTKEHESIVKTKADAQQIHQALIVTKALPGNPVQFVDPKTGKEDYKPAKGTTIRIKVMHMKKDKVVILDARDWIRDITTKQPLAHDWVFAGSHVARPPDNPNAEGFYQANGGSYISVANFPESMLDLPIKSPNTDDDRDYEIMTEKVPGIGTPVLLILEPVLEKK